mgnify:CR=1 FL=1
MMSLKGFFMKLLRKNISLILLMMSFLVYAAEENISDLVSTLAEPKANTVEVQQTTQEESEVSDEQSKNPEETENPAVNEPKSNVEEQANEPDEETAPPAMAKEPTVAVTPVIPKVAVPAVVPVEPQQNDAVASRVVSPVTPIVDIGSSIPKIVPKVAVSPVQISSPADAKESVTSKIVSAPKPTVSKSVTSPIQIVDISEAELEKGLDTLNVDSSGNWLEKRIWYQKAEQLFEVIRGNIQKAADLRMKFVHEVNQVGHKIDDFYENVSFEKGEIDEMLSAVLQDLSNQQEIRGGDLSSSERTIKSKVQVEQKHFEVLSKDLKLIDDLDDQIDKTMMKAFKEIDSCRGLETRAWNNFKEIGLELDDKKARVLFYEMENFHKNIEQKMLYLQNNLLPYLQNQLVSKVDETMTQIKSAIQIFDSKGLNLTKILKKDEHGDFLILKERDQAQVQEEALQAKKAAEAQKAKTKSTELRWYENVWCFILSFLQPVLCKLQEWLCVAICFVQSVFCNIWQWICRLIGY